MWKKANKGGGNVSWYSHYEKQYEKKNSMEVPQKTKNRIIIWSNNPTTRHIHRQTVIQKDICIPSS